MVAVCSVASMYDYEVLITTGALISIFLTSIGYMMGNALSNARLLTWSKGELYQVIVSMLIATTVLLAANFSCSLDVSVISEASGGAPVPSVVPADCAPAADTTIFSTAEQISKCVALQASKRLDPGVSGSLVDQLGELEIQASESEWKCELFCLLSTKGYSVSNYVGEYTTIGVVTMGMSLLSTAVITSAVQYNILLYIGAGMFMYFLPIAVAIRSVPYFRDVGGALIAIAFSLTVFYPLLVVVFGLTFFQAYGQFNDYSLYSLSLLYVGGIFLPLLSMVAVAVFGKELSGLLGQEIDLGRLAQLV